MDCKMPFRDSVSRNSNHPLSEEIFSAEKLISIGFLQTEERLKREEKNFYRRNGVGVGAFYIFTHGKFFFCLVASKILNINGIINFSFFYE